MPTRTRQPRKLSRALCTRHAINNLDKPAYDLKHAWQGISLENLEDFTDQAHVHLEAHSKLSPGTIDNVDWPKVLENFRSFAGWATTATPAPEDGVLARNTDGLSVAEPVTLTTVIAINAGDGTIRIHAHGCKCIKKDKERTDAFWTITAASRTQADEDIWGDSASDRYLPGTPEWKQECAENGSASSVYLPCVKFPDDAPTAKQHKRPVAATVTAPRTTVHKVVATLTPQAVANPKPHRMVPANWRYMADHADTIHARKWWTEYCEKRMRGEV